MCDVAERLEKMGIAKGIELGREEGKAEEKKASRVEFILRVLEIKGTVDEKTRKRIEEEQDVDLLDNWLTNALKANTVQEFETRLPFSYGLAKYDLSSLEISKSFVNG